MKSLSQTARLLETMLTKLTADVVATSVENPEFNVPTKVEKAIDPDAESISSVSLQVGKILSCEAHPDATSLLVEQIDLGEDAPRTICSGIAQHYADPSSLVGKNVVIVSNLEARKLRGIQSHGMVLCSTSENKETVEVLEAPQECSPGTRIRFPPCDAEPLKVLKKKLIKHWENVAPHLRTDDEGVAMYKSFPFMTEHGPVRSATLKNSPVS